MAPHAKRRASHATLRPEALRAVTLGVMTIPVSPPSDVVLRPADLPLPSGRVDPTRALFGTPSPEIGRPLLAWSDVQTDGTSLRALASAWNAGLRERVGLQRPTRNVAPRTRWLVSIFWALLWGAVGGPLLGVGLVLGLSELGNGGMSLPHLSSEVLFVLGIVALAALAFAVSYFVLWAPRFEARCVYVGTNGIEIHDVESGRVRVSRAHYAQQRPAVVASQHTLAGRVVGIRELLVMGELVLTGWSEGPPGEDTFLVREIARIGGGAAAAA